MTAFAMPALPRRMVTADWPGSASWRDSLAVLTDAGSGEAATRALARIFDAEWVSKVPDAPHLPHPFEYWLAVGGGIPSLGRLGHSLVLVGDLPEGIVRRLRDANEFAGAEFEIRCAATMVEHGASIHWADADGNSIPDFDAGWGSDRVAIEVKQLHDGETDLRSGEIDAADERLERSHAGVAIFERRWPPVWSPGLVEIIEAALVRGRFSHLGAVILRAADVRPGATRTAEFLHVLPGPKWSELPTVFTEAFPPGLHRVDLLPGSAPTGDPLRLDSFDHARAATPADRLAEALALMRVGSEWQRARLRRTHPGATAEAIDAMMARWRASDG